MAITIEWRREPDAQHTGSAELNGVANKPFIYVHPQDQAQQPIRSPCVDWRYNNQDMANKRMVAWQLFLNLQGHVSFDSYLLHRRQYQLLPASNRFEGWAGQDSTDQAFGSALATGLQPSGFGTYTAYLSRAPHDRKEDTVKVTATLRTFALFVKPLRARIGMGRSVSAEASAFDGPTEQVRCRSMARLTRFSLLSIRRSRKLKTYPVTIPPGGEVKIGKVQCGLGYEQRSGSSHFYTSSRIDFQIA